jgi:ankyrin repeat protein
VRRNDITLVRLLLEHGADPSRPEEGAPHGHALWIAVHDHSPELARLLLEHGADPNGMVESSGTPMMQTFGDPVLYELLRTHGGIEPNSPGDRLGRLFAQGRLAEAERMLRASPELMHKEYDTEGILMGPAHAGNHEVIALLMRLGARVPTVTNWGPYYYFKHEATAAFLLQHGMDPNHMNWHRLTLLHHTSAHGELSKARLLVDHGANIDAIDEEYRSTPLGLAARGAQRTVVAFLLERGADPNLAGAPWATPLAWARKHGHDDVAATLGAAGAA